MFMLLFSMNFRMFSGFFRWTSECSWAVLYECYDEFLGSSHDLHVVLGSCINVRKLLGWLPCKLPWNLCRKECGAVLLEPCSLGELFRPWTVLLHLFVEFLLVQAYLLPCCFMQFNIFYCFELVSMCWANILNSFQNCSFVHPMNYDLL